MKKFVLVFLSFFITNFASAGDADNISACVKKAKEFSGIDLDAFNVTYKGNLVSFSTAKWSNAFCEVKVGSVYTLQVNGEELIYKGYAGVASYELNEELARRTDEAINQMNSRIALLKQRKSQVSVSLQRPKPDHEWLTRYVDEGIEKSVGKL